MDNVMLTEQKKTSRFLAVLFSPNEKMPRYWMSVLSVFYSAVLVLVWEFVFPAIIPRLGNIFYELWILVSEKGLLFELGSTLKLILKAMLFSVPLAGLISFAGHTVNFAKPMVIRYDPGFLDQNKFSIAFKDNGQLASVNSESAPGAALSELATVLPFVLKDRTAAAAAPADAPVWDGVGKEPCNAGERLIGVFQYPEIQRYSVPVTQ